ncbi:hypothetical protein [Paracoccus litorisediminis]|uniref:Uncharacterized protein n=1 Tax=Paracoccus litorisediminis TaxID=2006130 RepID=A0A844HV05_9RHOB|nr:hypothetical protein [Paracoccus litorisediminis]MTH62135.1 hypothetical protein [Paracoccus litorisediminis]
MSDAPTPKQIPTLGGVMGELLETAKRLATEHGITSCCEAHAGAKLLAVTYLNTCRSLGESPAQAMQALPILAHSLSRAPEGETIH